MTSAKRRLDKLRSHLTPRQAILLWMAEAHQFDTLEEYTYQLKNQPDTAWPLRRLGDQITASVERSLKGKPKEEIDRALRQADLDVLTLYYLHESCNLRLMEKERYFATYSLMLRKELTALMREQDHNNTAMWNRMGVGLRLPYPLDPKTAAAVDAAIQHHVIPWEELQESDELTRWVTDSFLAEGKTELPEEAYRLREGHSNPSSTTDPEELSVLFANQEDFQKFLAGEDYSNGLADVTDAEYNERYETIVSAMQEFGLDGLMVELTTVPHAFLRDAPLVDGEWIDRYVVELAEWGARLVQQGFVVEESDDPHPLAWFKITNQEGGDAASPKPTLRLWQQAQKHLDRFPGRGWEIDGRVYLKWEDYLGWRGRRVKGDLKVDVSQGLAVSSWNLWVGEQSVEGKAILAGVPVGKLTCHAEGYQHQLCPDAPPLEREQRQRRSLLDSLWLSQPGSDAEERFNERVRKWKQLARDFLLELYSLRRVIDTINQRYFEGQQVLFPKVAEGFDELIDHIDKSADLYNRNLAEGLDHFAALVPEGDSQKDESFCLNPSTLDKLTEKPAQHQVAYLVDIAKVEALDTMGENRKAVELLDRHV